MQALFYILANDFSDLQTEQGNVRERKRMPELFGFGILGLW